MRRNILLTLILSPTIQCILPHQRKCVTTFNKRSICEHSYGNVLKHATHVPSVVVCGSHCSTEDACSSLMFNPSSKTCLTNSKNVTDVPSECSSPVLYAEVDKYYCPVGLNDPCSARNVCKDAHSICLDGTCKCEFGYSYHPGDVQCVELCQTYGTQYTTHPGFWFSNATRFSMVPLSESECRNMCESEMSFVCRAYAKFATPPKAQCLLTSETALIKPDAFRKTELRELRVSQRHCA